eukprot:1193761-Pyramimonas_sp.AAC.1
MLRRGVAVASPTGRRPIQERTNMATHRSGPGRGLGRQGPRPTSILCGCTTHWPARCSPQKSEGALERARLGQSSLPECPPSCPASWH